MEIETSIAIGLAGAAASGICVSALVLALGGGAIHSSDTPARGLDGLSSLHTRIPWVARLGASMTRARSRLALAEKYLWAGQPGRLDTGQMDALVGLACLGTAALTTLVLVLALGPIGLALGPAALMLGPGLLTSYYGGLANRRLQAIRRELPYGVDLIVLILRGGSSLLLSLRRVATDMRGGAFSDELWRVLTDLDLGRTRRESFEALARRVPEPEVSEFVETTLLAEELGRPVADALEQMADRQRTARVQSAEATAGRASVYVLLPGGIIFFVVMLLILAPFIIRWYRGELGG